MDKSITIWITSCGRYDLLKKTILSLDKTCDISGYSKILNEDSLDEKHIQKIKEENKDGFLQWWKIFFSESIWDTNYQKHYNALKNLYSHIDTPYIFHIEDDWLFEKKEWFNPIQTSKNILEKHSDIGIVQLRNFSIDGWLNHATLHKKERYKQLFTEKYIVQDWIKFYYMNSHETTWDICKWFSFNPWLRRTKEISNLMFWFEEYVDEIKVGKRFSEKWLHSVNMENGIIQHMWNFFASTKIIQEWNLKEIFIWTYNYRIKELIINRILKKKMFSFYQFLDSKKITRNILDIVDIWLKKIRVIEIPPDSLKNKEDFTDMNIDSKWFSNKKNKGISGVARLKNSEDFLEATIESYIGLLDEIILVNNMSTDTTEKICLKLQKKYPKIIKYFSYDYEVYPPWHNIKPTSNSIHSLAYYYNWSFSQSTYSHVMKLDDDNLAIKEKWDDIISWVLDQKNKYHVYWWINIIKKEEKYGFPEQYAYSWKYGDHWIYKVSPKTYYIQWENFEEFVCDLQYKRYWFSFLHLKFLKKWNWFFNLWNSEYKNDYISKISQETSYDFTKILEKEDLALLEKELTTLNI